MCLVGGGGEGPSCTHTPLHTHTRTRSDGTGGKRGPDPRPHSRARPAALRPWGAHRQPSTGLARARGCVCMAGRRGTCVGVCHRPLPGDRQRPEPNTARPRLQRRQGARRAQRTCSDGAQPGAGRWHSPSHPGTGSGQRGSGTGQDTGRRGQEGGGFPGSARGTRGCERPPFLMALPNAPWSAQRKGMHACVDTNVLHGHACAHVYTCVRVEHLRPTQCKDCRYIDFSILRCCSFLGDTQRCSGLTPGSAGWGG